MRGFVPHVALGVGLALVVALGVAPPAGARARTVDLPTASSVVLLGEHPGDLAGASVATAGDVNADGRADVVVGAPMADPQGRIDAGRAYVVFGGGSRGRVRLGALGSRGFRIDGVVPAPRSFHPGANPLTSGAGRVVAGAGDVNGDGLADVLVSSRVPGLGSPTAVYVVFGKRDSKAVDLASLGSAGYVIHANSDFTKVLAGRGAGDVNGDGRADVAVALSVDSDEDAGSVAIVFGKADSAPIDLSGPATGPTPWGLRVDGGVDSMLVGSADGTGSAAAAAGDVNGDGLGDVLLGAAGAAPGGRPYGTGSVFVVYGTRTPGRVVLRPSQPVHGFEFDGPGHVEGFGATVVRFGKGFVAGAPGNPYGRQRERGAVWIVRGRKARAIRIPGPSAGRPIGYSVGAPGDVNGDGRGDVLVVGRGHRAKPVAARLYSSTGRLLATYTGLRNAFEARGTADGAGDTRGTAHRDLVFGSPGTNRAYLVLSG